MKTREFSEYKRLFRSQIQNHFLTQQSLLKQKKRATVLNHFGDYLSVRIWDWFIHYFKSRFGPKHKFLEYPADNNGVFKMHQDVKMVVAADWATDTLESSRIGRLMNDERGDYTVHLGDTYFVGAPQEIDSNFLAPGNPWPRGKAGTLAIPGNHEFYSNGNSYFKKLLPHMFVVEKDIRRNQAASFFCLENDHWRVLGLDTGYYSVGKPILEWIFRPDAHFDKKIMTWLREVVKLDKNEKRGLVIFTHHPYFSSFERQYRTPATQLKSLIGDDKEVIWFWGHEHRFAVYGKFQSKGGIQAFGRCIGHGGMPVEVASRKSKPSLENSRKFNLVFYDQRQRTRVGNTPVGHNGYSTLAFSGARLVIQHRDENTWLLEEEWKIDNTMGKITGIKIVSNPAVGITPLAPLDLAVK